MENKRQKDYIKNTDRICKELAVLLANKNLNEITVKELCKKVGINRGTFYTHYENLNEAILDVVNVYKRFLLEMIEKYDIEKKQIESLKEYNRLNRDVYLVYYLEFIRKEKAFFASMLKKPELYDFKEVNLLQYRIFLKGYFDILNIKEKDKINLYYFYLYGTISLIYRWLESGCNETIEELIDHIYDCITFDFTK